MNPVSLRREEISTARSCSVPSIIGNFQSLPFSFSSAFLSISLLSIFWAQEIIPFLGGLQLYLVSQRINEEFGLATKYTKHTNVLYNINIFVLICGERLRNGLMEHI